MFDTTESVIHFAVRKVRIARRAKEA